MSKDIDEEEYNEEEDFMGMMSSSDRETSGYDIKDYVDLDKLDMAVEAYRTNRNQGIGPHLLKIKISNMLGKNILLEGYSEMHIKSHMGQLRHDLKHRYGDEHGIRIFLRQGSNGSWMDPDWIIFKDLTHVPDPSAMNPKAILALQKHRIEKNIQKIKNSEETEEEKEKAIKKLEKQLTKIVKELDSLEGSQD